MSSLQSLSYLTCGCPGHDDWNQDLRGVALLKRLTALKSLQLNGVFFGDTGLAGLCGQVLRADLDPGTTPDTHSGFPGIFTRVVQVWLAGC